jgi:ABC-type nickel/cobalt efflux system permease component RcnA
VSTRPARWLRRIAVVAGGVAVFAGASAVAASAHPLGNFTVNYYEGLTLSQHEIGVLVVVDSAELPTYNRIQPAVDTNGDNHYSSEEMRGYAAVQCPRLASGLDLTVAQARVPLRSDSAEFALLPSPTLRGLSTGRLTCHLSAQTDLSSSPMLGFDDHVDSTYGWHEITAVGQDVHITSSSVNGSNGEVASKSISDELRHYPNGLLSSPLSVRSVDMQVAPGAGPAAAGVYRVTRPNALTAALQPLTNAFERTAGSRQLTLPVIALAIVLSLLLGAGHAALPGHGKTVMAAYLVGRRGTFRDAMLVGTTVTFSHTVGVLVLGMAIALSAAWVDTTTLQYLGVLSGALIAMVGAGLLRSTIKARRRGGADHSHHHRGDPHPHEHGHDHGHDHAHAHDHGHRHPTTPEFSRRGLVSLGIAGGLVPSPSALVVLLSAVALGRTAFGVVLVLGYGIGMAVTLMGAGLMLAKVGGATSVLVRGRFANRYVHVLPLLTATLVIVVGCGLALRSAALT